MNVSLNDTSDPQFQTFSYFTQLLFAYGVPVICIFGIVGNIFSFRVFVFKSFRNNSSSAYIAALSVSDSCFLLSLFLSWLGNGKFGFLLSSSPIWCQIMIFVTSVCSFLSVWYVVLIMIDRYLVVCHSLRVPELCTKRRANMATLAVTTFSVMFNSHYFVTAEVHGDHCSVQEKSSMLHVLTIFIYIDTALTFIIPFAIIFILNTVVIISIKRFHLRHVQQRRTHVLRTNTVSKAQMRITRTFTLVSIVLLITNVPSHGIRFFIMINNLYENQDTVLVSAQQIFQVIYYTNFAVNFLLYSASNDKFRRYFSYKYICYTLYRRQRQSANDHLYR